MVGTLSTTLALVDWILLLPGSQLKVVLCVRIQGRSRPKFWFLEIFQSKLKSPLKNFGLALVLMLASGMGRRASALQKIRNAFGPLTWEAVSLQLRLLAGHAEVVPRIHKTKPALIALLYPGTPLVLHSTSSVHHRPGDIRT